MSSSGPASGAPHTSSRVRRSSVASGSALARAELRLDRNQLMQEQPHALQTRNAPQPLRTDEALQPFLKDAKTLRTPGADTARCPRTRRARDLRGDLAARQARVVLRHAEREGVVRLGAAGQPAPARALALPRVCVCACALRARLRRVPARFGCHSDRAAASPRPATGHGKVARARARTRAHGTRACTRAHTQTHGRTHA
jgi:hypothetical protein